MNKKQNKHDFWPITRDHFHILRLTHQVGTPKKDKEQYLSQAEE